MFRPCLTLSHRKRATTCRCFNNSIPTLKILPISSNFLCWFAILVLVASQLMNMNEVVTVDEKFCFPEETHLTVRKTSLFFPGDGFVVYDPNGEILFRFDSYGPDSKPKDELVLMDSSGKCLLTLLRKVSLLFFCFFSPLFSTSLKVRYWTFQVSFFGSIR